MLDEVLEFSDHHNENNTKLYDGTCAHCTIRTIAADGVNVGASSPHLHFDQTRSLTLAELDVHYSRP